MSLDILMTSLSLGDLSENPDRAREVPQVEINTAVVWAKENEAPMVNEEEWEIEEI